MIKSIAIRNFALIQKCDLNFDGGFTVITGETGSGKSILLNALKLVLGERADFSVIGMNGDKAIVEIVIDLGDFELQNFFIENELDYFSETIIRREVTKQGRSRAFINDSPVQLNVLRDLVGQLVQIHSQYSTLELKDEEFQLKVYDILADTLALRKEYEASFSSLKFIEQKLNESKELLSQAMASRDYNSFQLEEINALNLKSNDYSSLLEELKAAEGLQGLHEQLSTLVSILAEGSTQQLHSIRKALELSDSSRLSELGSRLAGVLIELNEIERDASDLLNDRDVSPQEIELMRSKLDEYLRLLTKHRLENQEQLALLQEQLSSSEENTDNLVKSITELELQLENANEKSQSLAKQLSIARKDKKNQIAQELLNLIIELKLEDTRLEFKFEELETLRKSGKDRLELYFSPNKGIEPVPVHKAASGGELSRVMLALQNLLSQHTKLKTIFFDEIDTGVSGEVAQKVGKVLQSMGKGMQVIAITHLPQVAAKGTQHFNVSKSADEFSTLTSVEELSNDQRILEIARLMSGESITEGALLNAKALMN